MKNAQYYAQLKDKNPATLIGEKSELQKKIQQIRFELAFGKTKNTSSIKTLRRTIAQIETYLTQLARKEIKNEKNN